MDFWSKPILHCIQSFWIHPVVISQDYEFWFNHTYVEAGKILILDF